MQVSQKELADFFGVSPRTIRRWTDQGMPREPHGTYRTDRCVDWKIERERDDIERTLREVPPKAESEAKLAAFRARMQELDLADREGRIISREVFEEVLGATLDLLRRGIMNMPGRWAVMVASELDVEPREAESVLRRLARELLEDLSTSVADELESGEPDGPDPAA